MSGSGAVLVLCGAVLWCADQFEAMQEELYQRRDECLQLRAVLASRDSQSSENIVNPLIGSEELELKMAYNSQRDLKRLILITLYRTTEHTIRYNFLISLS